MIGMTDIATLNNSVGIVVHLPIEDKLQEMLINATLSVISLDLSKQMQSVQTETWETIYVYSNPERLSFSYGIALFFAIFAVALGSYSLYKNGEPGDRGFMQVLVATRNPELDLLTVSDGTDNMVRQLQGMKLRYGRSMEGDKKFFGTIATIFGH
jgi:hypothetical protein